MLWPDSRTSAQPSTRTSPRASGTIPKGTTPTPDGELPPRSLSADLAGQPAASIRAYPPPSRSSYANGRPDILRRGLIPSNREFSSLWTQPRPATPVVPVTSQPIISNIVRPRDAIATPPPPRRLRGPPITREPQDYRDPRR